VETETKKLAISAHASEIRAFSADLKGGAGFETKTPGCAGASFVAAALVCNYTLKVEGGFTSHGHIGVGVGLNKKWTLRFIIYYYLELYYQYRPTICRT